MTGRTVTAAAGTIAGIVLAVVYILSPMTVWFAVAMIPVFVLAGWGLPREERRWVWALLATAIGVRVLMVAGLLVSTDPEQVNVSFSSFFFDNDGSASKLRSLWIRNAWLELPIEPFAYHAFARDYGWTTYLNVIAYAQYLLGPAPYGIHFLNIGFFMGAAVILYQVARRAYGGFSATIGLGILLLFPGTVLWSSSAMKESFQYALIAAVVVACIETLRREWWLRRAAAALAAVMVFAALMTVKREIAWVTLSAVAVGATASFVIRRRSLLLIAPLVLAIGVWAGIRQDAVRERATAVLARAVALHMGHVNTRGHHYKLLDQEFYSSFDTPDYSDRLTPAQTARFVIRGLAAFLVVPLPWQALSTAEILFVPAQMFWYCILLLAAAGLASALRRDVLVTAVFISSCALFAVARGITEGNIGTLVRHRDIVVPFLAWFSGIGAACGLAWVARLSTPPSRTAGVSAGVPHRDDEMALRQIAALGADSRLFRVADRVRAAWAGAHFLGLIGRLLGQLSGAERLHGLGWMILVALAAEVLFAVTEGLGVDVLGLGVRGGLLAVAVLLIAHSRRADAAWREWRRRAAGRVVSAAPGSADTTLFPSV